MQSEMWTGMRGDDTAILDEYAAPDIAGWRRGLDAGILRLITPVLVVGEWGVAGARAHWLLLFNFANILLFLGTFVSPALAALGWSAAAHPAFAVYQVLCLQRPEHSFFLWGYQMGMEERMVALPAAQALAGLVYAAVHRRRALRPLNAWWFLLWSAPMLFDIFSQSLGWRDSDAIWRVATGSLFGVASVWLFFPLFAWAWEPGPRAQKVRLRLNGSWHF